MKKVFLGFFTLLTLFYIVTPTPSTLAKTSIETTLMKENVATDEAVPAPEATVRRDEYPLPYPGILPDNPLHFLKALRDRIILMLTSDPIKEAEFNLLTSDKRIYAAQLLADKGKDALSVSTLSKSNNYFHNAVSSISEAKKMGKRVDIVLNSMKKSIVKHQEVLSMMRKVLSFSSSNQLQIEEKRMADFGKTVDSLLLK